MSTQPLPDSSSTRAVGDLVPNVALATIAPSPTNPRKRYDPKEMADLADSVRVHGVITPVLLRPWPASRPKPKGWKMAPGYELVAGERRTRAAQAAGLEAVPAVVRELTDQETLELQLVENLQRNDLHALEEAGAYQQLVAGGSSVDSIARRVGKSEKYVYDRIKLLELIPELQRIFTANEITAGHAVILARLDPKDQKRVLTDDRQGLFQPESYSLLARLGEDGSKDEARKPCSVRELQGWVNRHAKLEAAQVDPMLFPETAATIAAATLESEKVVRITREETTPEELKGKGPAVILGRSWRRADGLEKSKTCDHSIIGMVVLGQGRGEAIRVCTAKDKCTVHWKDRVAARKRQAKAVGKAVDKGADKRMAEQQAEAAAEAREKAEAERRKKAWPAVLQAVATAVQAASPRTLQDFVLGELKDHWLFRQGYAQASRLVPLGKTPAAFVVHVAHAMAYATVADRHGLAPNDGGVADVCKAFGVKLAEVIDAAAPRPKPEPKAKAAKPAGPIARKAKAKGSPARAAGKARAAAKRKSKGKRKA